MRIFNYEAYIYISDSQNMLNYELKGMVAVENDHLFDKDITDRIKQDIIWKQIPKRDQILSITLTEIPKIK